MMTHLQKMQQFLDSNNVNMNVHDFVSVTSNIYHSFEAEHYDDRHDSITKSIGFWKTVSIHLTENFKGTQNLEILDFGCGTGFATSQILDSELNEQIGSLSCYDLSTDMIQQCKSKFVLDARISYYADQNGLERLIREERKFDIIVSNSLVHHLLDPQQFFKLINNMLRPNGIFVMGHEPNKLFYSNNLLQKVTKAFRIYKRVHNRVFKVGKMKSENIALQTHQKLIQLNLVDKNFSSSIIPKFVDIHVPMSSYNVQPWGENGFDETYVKNFLDDTFTLSNQISYNHIKDEMANKSAFWRFVNKILAKNFPHDGADVILIFKKEI